MSIKHAAITLNEFYKIVHQLPDSLLKTELESHVQEMVSSMLKSCLMRNQQRNFILKVQHYNQQDQQFITQWDELFHAKNSVYS